MKVLNMSQVDNLLPEHIKSTIDEVEVDSEGEINMERVPFAKNTIRMDIKQIDKNLKAMSAQNKENLKEGVADANQNRSCTTPTNEVEVQGQPLTPTANLKVLFNAMSPELRNRDEQKRDTSDEDMNPSSDTSPSNSQQDYPFETIIELRSSQELDTECKFGSSRKEKSLGLLCQKFLQKYPEYPKANEKYDICLDEVAKELQVERRRIYDIVNVLESVEIVSRVAKNKYAWHGKSNLYTTLAKLKALGDSEGFGEQIQKLKDYEFHRELEEQLGRCDSKNKMSEPDFSIFGENSLFNQAALRKDKSLGIMSQKFLMLFLVSKHQLDGKPKTVNLDLSAKLLIGDANIDKTENAKFKTKIRRLYDIANILTSLDLICKVHVTEIRGRKPAFKYVGPNIETTKELHLGNNPLACCSDGCHRPSSRHSMLDCIQNQNVAKMMGSYKSILPGAKRSSSDSEGGSSQGTKMSRHSSFEQLCAVAAVETNRMKSEPASGNSETEQKPVVNVLHSDGSLVKVTREEADKTAPNKMPTKGFSRRKSMTKSGEQSTTSIPQAGPSGKTTRPAGKEAIIIKTKSSIAGSASKQLPLSPEQIDAVLRSLKVPVPVSKEQLLDATTQSSIEEEAEEMVVEPIQMKEQNEKTPVVTVNVSEVVGNKRPAPSGDMIPPEKRTRLDFPSPTTSTNDLSPCPTGVVTRFKRKNSTDTKPSPQRALHLAPEFVNPTVKVNMTPSGDATKLGEAKIVEGMGNQPKKIEIIITESVGNSTPSKTVLKTQTFTSPSAKQPVQIKPVQRTLQQQPAQTLAVQLPNQPNAIIHVPIVNVGSAQRTSQAMSIPMQQTYHLVTRTGGNMPQVVHVPGPVSRTLNVTSSPTVYPAQTSYTCTNVHIVQPATVVKGLVSTSPNLIRPIATKAVVSPNPGSQIVPPQLITSSNISSTAQLGKTTGGFVPVSSSMSNITKLTVVNTKQSQKEFSAVLS